MSKGWPYQEALPWERYQGLLGYWNYRCCRGFWRIRICWGLGGFIWWFTKELGHGLRMHIPYVSCKGLLWGSWTEGVWNSTPWEWQGLQGAWHWNCQTENVWQQVLQDVRYVPELKRNLISISMFDLMGYITKVENGMMKVSTGASVIAKGRWSNGLYILEGSTVIGHVSVAS